MLRYTPDIEITMDNLDAYLKLISCHKLGYYAGRKYPIVASKDRYSTNSDYKNGTVVWYYLV